jgi:hypothetical protein
MAYLGMKHSRSSRYISTAEVPEPRLPKRAHCHWLHSYVFLRPFDSAAVLRKYTKKGQYLAYWCVPNEKLQNFLCQSLINLGGKYCTISDRVWYTHETG